MIFDKIYFKDCSFFYEHIRLNGKMIKNKNKAEILVLKTWTILDINNFLSY